MIKHALATLALTLSLASSAAKAQDFSAVYMLQMTLNDHGFDVGEPDGLLGPATGQAIAGFADEYGFPSEPNALISALVQRSVTNSIKITREANLTDVDLAEVEKNVGALLRDPSSVQVRNVRIAESPEGRFYCGEVNGKNAYGGYGRGIAFGT